MKKQPNSPTSAVRFSIWVATAKKLRSSAIAADAEYWRHLQTGECDDLMWREAGYATFDAALERLHKGTAAMYRSFLAALERFGWEHVRAVGFEQTRVIQRRVPIEAMSIVRTETSASDAIMADCEAFVRKNKMPPSTRTVTAFVAKHYMPPPDDADPPPDDTDETPEEQNKRLRLDNASLAKALAKAREKIRELTAELAQANAELSRIRVLARQRGRAPASAHVAP